MQDKEGSKAMSIYIVICFLLAGAAGVGFKLKMTERDEVSSDYARLYSLNQKVGAELSPNIADYWTRVSDGRLVPVDQERLRRAVGHREGARVHVGRRIEDVHEGELHDPCIFPVLGVVPRGDEPFFRGDSGHALPERR